MVRVLIVALGVLVAVALVVPEGRASLHHVQQPVAIPVDDKGTPQSLPFEEFKRRLLVLRNASNVKMPFEEEVVNSTTKKTEIQKTERGKVKDRIDAAKKRISEAKKKGQKLPQIEVVALAVDQLYAGQLLEAESTLASYRRGFLPNITLAHIVASQARKPEDWERASIFLGIANDDEPPSAASLGLTQQQLDWQIKLNKGPLLELFKLRWEEARGPKKSVEDELPDAIFAVKFVNEAGAYEPGVLAPAEKAKLPPDAIAIVQQLVLWFPHDTRLYWLLGELYAANGDFKAAKKIMDECVDSLGFSNRKVLMEHRQPVTKAAEKVVTPEEEPLFTDKPTEQPHLAFTMGAVWVYIGVVAALATLVFLRAMWKRRKGTA
ncbi:MAG: tetratricopeptide repeat protein [Planctomycetia bacterium]|nr:tetratricopeptide repeat protein [Planctomycetia bacterium]